MESILSPIVKETLEELVYKCKPGLMYIECKFNLTSIGEEIEVKFINELTVTQDYITNYLDNIILKCDLDIENYILLVKNYREVNCTLIIKQVEAEHPEIEYETLFQQTYRVILKDKPDLTKIFGPKELIKETNETDLEQYHSVTVPLTVQLIHQNEYIFKKKKFNFIATFATVKDIIYLLCYLLKVKLELIEPDNDKIYENFLIPHMGLPKVFDFLQNSPGKGVYDHGLTYYYTNEVLYVYPPYDISKTRPNTVKIYRTPAHMFLGKDGYHFIEDDILNIVMNNPTININPTDSMLENLGNSFLIQNGEFLVDEWYELGAEGIILNELLSENTKINTSEGSTNYLFSPEFRFSQDNKYKIKSTLVSFTNELVAMRWTNALPFLINPGDTILYYYDEKDKFTERKAICNKLVFHITPTDQHLIKRMYSANADIILQLENEEP